MPPKHDLRGGNASDDSFEMSRSVLTASITRCFLAADRQRIQEIRARYLSHKNLAQVASHRLMEVVSE